MGEFSQFREVRRIVPPHINKGKMEILVWCDEEVLTHCWEEQEMKQLFVDTSEIPFDGRGLDSVVSGSVSVY